MQNLLTIEYKKNIRRLYHARVFTVALFVACVVSVISLILLATLSFLLYATSFDSINQQALLDKNNEKNTLKSEYHSFLQSLAALPAGGQNQNTSFSNIFDLLLAKKETGIFLREISFSGGGGKGGNVVLRGTAQSRPVLVSFTEALRSEPLFSGVDSPVSNLLKEQNLDFSLTITIKEAKTDAKKP